MEPISNTDNLDKKSPLSAHTYYPIHSLQKQGIFPSEPRMMMSAFNTSTRREDMSLRLRAQNMRSAKEQTKKLELESRKMEERLKELKVAMSREKEERERSGGGFWRTGQSGTLSSYATHVLDKPTKSSAKDTKKKAIRVLKDEPLDLPSRSSEPGTMKYIAKTSQILGKENRAKGPKCGQCEDRAACLTCVQCSEHYCSGCFAAFHLRGALKKHRSVPLQASGPRQCMSPRPTPPPSFRGEGKQQPPAVGAVSSSISYQECERNRPEGASGSYENTSLLGGQYNEAESAASFQAALQAWRKGDTPESSPRLAANLSPRSFVSASPSKPIMSVDSSTCTPQQPVSPNIKFSNTISYADRLLLKQHRRTDPGGLGGDDYPSPRSAALSHTSGAVISRDNTLDLSEDSRVRFSALYQASLTDVNAANSETNLPPSSLAIVEFQESQQRVPGDLEQTDRYQVQEIGSFEAWQLQSYRKSPDSSRSASQLTHTSKTHCAYQQMAREDSLSSVQITDLTGSSLDATCIPDTTSQGTGNEQKIGHVKNKKQKEEMERPKSRPASRRARQSARPKSSRQSRPNSRALSRAGSTLREGVLTKSPSSALKEIASRLHQTETQVYSPSLQDFFLAGVKPDPQERSLTPSYHRTNDTVKVSNRLYQMAPRSWRPNSSLGESIPVQDEFGSGAGTVRETVISYTYSSQLQQPSTPNRCQSPVQSVSSSQRSRSPGQTQSTSNRQSAGQESGRASRIVMDGDDLSRYDEVYVDRNEEDMETLHQLEWELASESGRITADGQMSRLSVMNSMSDSGSSSRSSTPLIKLSMDKGFDINIKLREDELIETVDENANHTKDEQEVKELH